MFSFNILISVRRSGHTDVRVLADKKTELQSAFEEQLASDLFQAHVFPRGKAFKISGEVSDDGFQEDPDSKTHSFLDHLKEVVQKVVLCCSPETIKKSVSWDEMLRIATEDYEITPEALRSAVYLNYREGGVLEASVKQTVLELRRKVHRFGNTPSERRTNLKEAIDQLLELRAYGFLDVFGIQLPNRFLGRKGFKKLKA